MEQIEDLVTPYRCNKILLHLTPCYTLVYKLYLTCKIIRVQYILLYFGIPYLKIVCNEYLTNYVMNIHIIFNNINNKNTHECTKYMIVHCTINHVLCTIVEYV